MTYIQSIFLPFSDQMQQQGLMFDIQSIVDLVAQNANMPELKEIIKMSDGTPLENDNQPVGQPPSHIQGGETKRKPRESARTEQGTNAAQLQQIIGGQVQPNEQAFIGGG